MRRAAHPIRRKEEYGWRAAVVARGRGFRVDRGEFRKFPEVRVTKWRLRLVIESNN